jgi:hypothetical protein
LRSHDVDVAHHDNVLEVGVFGWRIDVAAGID